MATSTGTYNEVNCNNNKKLQGSYNGSSVNGEWGVPTFQHQQTISMDWSPEEQALLEEGLCKYASETSIIRYAKIAVQLRNKTVRDVALRCRWMTKKEISKRRKEDFNARKIKDRKEKGIDSLAKPVRLGVQSSGLSHAPPGLVSKFNDDVISYNDAGGAARQLLQQNAWVFKQISTNLATHQIHENICLLSRARDNIFKVLINLNDMGPTMRKMPPLPKTDHRATVCHRRHQHRDFCPSCPPETPAIIYGLSSTAESAHISGQNTTTSPPRRLLPQRWQPSETPPLPPIVATGGVRSLAFAPSFTSASSSNHQIAATKPDDSIAANTRKAFAIARNRRRSQHAPSGC
ncbi:Protein of unknown function (DUF3755 [Striga hermonthica]|uniref:Myb-like domain-containing protein n=1 Tax=Striga hermonthica TaxID=68872 RepID=A0A9N7NYD1_STRHE|nr:Protein of unknown function (DUF3755 [Striga hermonthica]